MRMEQVRMRNEIDGLDRGNPVARKALMLLGVFAVLILVSASSFRPSAPDTPSTTIKCQTCEGCTGGKIQNEASVDEVFPIKIISDKDRASKTEDGEWHAILRSGSLTRHADTGTYSIAWNKDDLELRSQHSYKGRGMELSELIRFDGRLLTFDDTTGIVYEIKNGQALPWQILNDGDGVHTNKGFKCEWATVKGNLLYVGSLGKEWTHPTSGEVLNKNPQFIKVLSRTGQVESIDWSENYNKLRKFTNTLSPGYLLHESCVWHERLGRWMFLPRRLSTEVYNEEEDEHRAANVMLLASEDFGVVEVVKNMGPFSPTHGFSSFKLIPTHDTELVALKTEEVDGAVSTYLTVLNLKGEVLMPETLIDHIKFEGVYISA